MIQAIDLIAELDLDRLLHGHEPLTLNWPTSDKLPPMDTHLAWLRDQVRNAIRAGKSRGEIHRQNLVPTSLFDDPASQGFFLVMREHVIDRLDDQNVDYWQSDLCFH